MASREGRLHEGITDFATSSTPTIAPYSDTKGTDNELPKEPEDGFDYENADYGFARNTEMAQDIMVTFLGTSSGGGPTKTRNCSSLLVDMLGDGTLWSAYYSLNQLKSPPRRLCLIRAI